MHTPRGILVLAAAALLVAAPDSAAAQPGGFPTLAPGQVLSGRLESGDPTFSRFGRFQVYQFQARPGVRYVARMNSRDFDSYLAVARVVRGITDVMREDDDGGEGLNSLLRFTVPSAGTYLIIAKSLREDGLGEFTVSLDTVAVRPAPVRDATLGQRVTGALVETDAEFEDGSGFFHLFRFRGDAGQRIRVVAESGDFFPVLEVGTMEGDSFVPLPGATAEFSSGSVGATLPQTGAYVVRVGGWDLGEYSVTIREVNLRPAETRPIARGQTLTGELGTSDVEREDGRGYEAFSFRGRAGERVVVSLRSSAFDAYLFLGRMHGTSFEELAGNDDSTEEEGFDSRIDFVLPADGEYVLHASSFRAGATGTFEVVFHD